MKFRARIAQDLNTQPQLHSLRKFIKKELNYWYKRGSSRSISSKEPSCKYWQSIFSWRIISSIYSGQTIINVDESIFSRSVKSNYSWLPRGESSWILTPNHLSRWVVYFALWSSGEWMALISNNIGNSNRFCMFLFLLKRFIESALNLKLSRVILTLDNASTHWSHHSKKGMKALNLKGYFLPPYSPTLAPVELVFSIMKNFVSKRRNWIKLNFSKKSGRKALKDSLEILNKAAGLKLWIRFIIEAKKILILVREDEIEKMKVSTSINNIQR